STLAQPPRGPLLGDRPVSEQTAEACRCPVSCPALPRPPTPPPPATPGSMLNEQQQPPQPPPPPPPASMPTGGQRRVLLDEPPPPSLETAAADRDQQTDEDAEVKQAELFLEQLASWLANIKSYESDMNEYFQSCAQQMHEHYASSQQTEDSKKIHETEYRKLYDEYEKFAAYMRQMSQHYEDTKADLEKRRAKAVERRDKRLAEQQALKEKQLAAHAEPPPTRSLTNNAEQLLSDSLLVEAYSTTSTAALTTTNSTTASMTTASALGAAAAAAVSALSRMDLSDPDSWNKFAATLPANSDTASYYKLYSNQMVANFQRMLVGVPAAEAERLSVSFAATLQSEAPGGGAGGGADSGGESDSGIAGGLTLQGLSRNQRKKLRKRAKALQDAKAAKRQHRKLLLAAPASGPTEKGGATDSTGGAGDNADEDADAKPTPPPGYMDPAGDPRLVMQDYFERFANGEWNYATWNQYITVMQRHNPAWYEVFIAQSKQHGINWDDMYRYYTGGKAADHLADLTGGRLTSASGAGDGPPSILELAAQPAPPPPPERLFDDDNNEKASAQAKHQMWVDAQVGAIKRSGLGGIFECLLCNVKCNSQKSLDFHVNGDKHKKLIEERVKELEAVQREKDAAEAAEQAKKAEAEAAQKAEAEAKLKAEQAAAAAKQQQQKQKSSGGRGAKPTLRAQTLLNSCLEPLLGLQYVTEYQRINPMLECRCYCELCNLNFPVAELINHATGIRHRRLFFRAHYPDLFAILSQDRSPRSVKIRRYSVYAQRVEDWEGRKKMNLKVEVETTDESGSQGQLQSKSAAAAAPAAPVVKYTLKSSKRPRNAAAKQNRGRGGVDLEEGEIDGDAVELSDGGAADEESDPEEGEALDNAGPPEQPGVVFEDAILIDREPLTNIDKNSGSKVDNGDIAATREAFIKRLKEQKVLSTSEATKEVLDSISREADWAIKRKKRAAGIVEDDADLIKFGATVANSAGSDATSSSSSGQPQQQQQQQQQHMTSLVEQIRSMTGINLGISRAQADAFRIPSIPGLRLDIDRIKDTPDPVAQMRN
uniref:U1-type domain-containing protein n=1 Tax=Macrostomum lignano TaxID=282301 RepID=A0A1I8I2G7_9PLAT